MGNRKQMGAHFVVYFNLKIFTSIRASYCFIHIFLSVKVNYFDHIIALL